MKSATATSAGKGFFHTSAESVPDPTELAEGFAKDLSTVALVRQISAEVGELAQKEMELAKAELKSDLKSEAMMVGGLGLAALAFLTTINLLLVTVILALAETMPGWAAGLVVSGFTLAVTGVVGLVAWSRRVPSFLASTRGTLREEIAWAKERLMRTSNRKHDGGTKVA
jgi:hypothetical protein